MLHSFVSSIQVAAKEDVFFKDTLIRRGRAIDQLRESLDNFSFLEAIRHFLETFAPFFMYQGLITNSDVIN